jgi:hypothetical protein
MLRRLDWHRVTEVSEKRSTFKGSVYTYQSTRRNIPEGFNLQFEYTRDLKPYIIMLMYNLQTIVHLILVNSYPLTNAFRYVRYEYYVTLTTVL